MKLDIAQKVTNQIIDMIENGQADGQWESPWNRGYGLPVNASTGKFYRGINTLLLWGHEYQSNTWATFKQWQKMGHKLVDAKGKGQMIVFWKIIEKKEKQPDGTEKIVDKIPFLRYSTVFNADLVPTYEEPKLTLLDASERFELAFAQPFIVDTADKRNVIYRLIDNVRGRLVTMNTGHATTLGFCQRFDRLGLRTRDANLATF